MEQYTQLDNPDIAHAPREDTIKVSDHRPSVLTNDVPEGLQQIVKKSSIITVIISGIALFSDGYTVQIGMLPFGKLGGNLLPQRLMGCCSWVHGACVLRPVGPTQ